MAVKALKRAGVPAALGLGLASFRVYAVSQTGEEEEEDRLPPQELSIYAPPVQNLRYVEEQPGFLQRTFSRLRLGMQNVEGTCSSVKVAAVNIYHTGQDGSAGFVLRLGAITVCGLAGLVLARKGSRLKRLGVPLGTAAVGAALCFPAQTVGVLKLTGKNIHAASQWSSSAVMSLWKTPGSAKEAIIQPAVLKQGVRVADSEVKEPNAKLLTEVQPAEQALPSSDKPSSIPAPVEEVTSEFGPEVDLMEKTPACTVETTSQLFTLQPDVPGHTECISTLISHPENPIMNESVPPAKLKPEFPPGPEPVPLPVPEPEHVIVKESVPTSTPEPSLSSIPKSVPQPIPEPELPTVKESIPAHILERELPTPTAPPLISQPVSTSLPSTVSTPLEEPSPPFEPTFLPAEELLQISLEPEPEPKPSVATECGSLEDSTSDPTLEAELATEAALIHIDELLPIFAAPDPVELPTPPCLETPKSAVVVDTLAEECAVPADVRPGGAAAHANERSPEFSAPEENGRALLEDHKPASLEAIIARPSEDTESAAVEEPVPGPPVETTSPLSPIKERSTMQTFPPVEISTPTAPQDGAPPSGISGVPGPGEEVILLSPAAEPDPVEPSGSKKA